MTSRNTVSHAGPQPAPHRPALAGLRPRRGWELHPGVRSGDRLTVAERAADTARDALGSWTFAGAGVLLIGLGVALAVRHDGADPVAVLTLVLSGLVLAEVSVVLMAARRADRITGEHAVHDLDVARRVTAAVEELHDEVERLRRDLARLAAWIDTSNRRDGGDRR